MSFDETAGYRPDPRITEFPATFIRDWIMLCPDLPDASFRAYCVIRAHIWEKDPHHTVRLTQKQIAAMVGKSEERTRKILRPLLKVGLLEVAGKKTWWEYNDRLRRKEQRSMNVYEVRDFPPDDYTGPRSMKDFSDRFGAPDGTDRSETTARSRADVSAGQTHRSETTGRSSSQVSDVSAGQTDRSKMTKSAVKNDRPYKNSFQEGEGEDGNARARASIDPTPAAEPIAWGARGGRAAPTQADADAIAAIVARCLPQGDGIRPVEHQELATALATAIATVEADGLSSRAEFVEWLGQGLLHDDGRPRWREDLVGVLAWRLRPENYRLQLLGWRARQRAEDPERGPRGEREPFNPATKPEAPGVCGVHRTTLTADSQCLVCLSEVEAEQAAYGPQTNVDSPEPPTGPVDPAAGSDGDSEDPDEIRALIEQSLNSASRRGADHGGREGRGWTPPPVVAELRERLTTIRNRSA